MIRFNLSGLIMLIIAAFAGLATSAVVGEAWPLATAGLLIPMDIAYRWRSSEDGWQKWLAGRSGGFLGITPVWITGLLLLGLHFSGWLSLS
ncbi:MAG: hypothetical protein AAF633_02055 [Chloroflexota bacterium]